MTLLTTQFSIPTMRGGAVGGARKGDAPQTQLRQDTSRQCSHRAPAGATKYQKHLGLLDHHTYLGQTEQQGGRCLFLLMGRSEDKGIPNKRLGKAILPSPSMSSSQASPFPSPSVSFWSLFRTVRQLSQASPKMSLSLFLWSTL